MGITIIADAVSNLFPAIIKENNLNVRIMNMHLTIGDREYNCYNDEIDVKEFSKTYYQMMDEGYKTSTTLVNTYDFLEVFKEEVKKGNKVICFCMAKGISGTYNSAVLAATEINENHKEELIHVIDTRTAGLGEGMQAIHADELVKQGKSFEEVVEECERYKLFVRSDFTVDNIKFLLSTGRVSRLFAKFANLINIKVLLKHNDESKIAFAGSVIGRKNSIKKLCKIVLDKIDTNVDQVIYITHCDAIVDAIRIKELLREGGIKNKIKIYDYDLVGGAHIGPRSLAVFYLAREGETD